MNIKHVIEKLKNDELFNYYEYTMELMSLLKKMEHKMIIDKMIENMIDKTIEKNTLHIVDRESIKQMLDFRIIGFKDEEDEVTYNLYPTNIYSMILSMGVYVEPELVKNKQTYYVMNLGTFSLGEDDMPVFTPDN